MKRFKFNIILFLSFIVCFLAGCNTGDESKGNRDPGFTLELAAPVSRWDEAVPLGNGLTGGLLWGGGNEIRLSLDRGDLWDIREHPGFTTPGFSYETVKQMANSGRADSLNKKFSRVSDFPTKLPGCRLVITLPGADTIQSFQLDMKKALGIVRFGNQFVECFFSQVRPVALIKIPGEVTDFSIVANKAIEKLGNPQPVVDRDPNSTWLFQSAALGFQYAFLVMKKQAGGYTFFAVTSATNKDSGNPLEFARKQATEALNKRYDQQFRDHKKWWDDFWGKSSVTLPDQEIQRHYNLIQYYYGAASRKGAPPMPLQGVWTADEGKLPPWHGDYHHDLNTQLTYWAYLASNRFEQGESFLDFMWSLKPVHEAFARNFYGVPGLVVPGVMSFDGKPMGAWFQYSLSPTMGAWIAQSFYWHWRYTMDMKFLKERAYPYCTGVAEALSGLMKPYQNGKLKLFLSSSPEIHNNSQQAWLTPNSNFDLSLIRWIFGANAEMADALGLGQETAHWKELLSKMDELAISEKDSGLLVSPGEPLTESHRHFSHLMAIHPLGIVSTEGSEMEKRIIEASFRQIDELGTKLWCGYSFSWMACMRARAGQSGEALGNLKNYLACTLRNGFHVNGVQTRSDLPAYKMRAFTLEGNFAAGQAVHEMLLQSWGGKLRIFPAVPKEWADVSFKQLRAEGGFMVTAERREGKTTLVEITSTTDQFLKLKNPFDGGFESNRSSLDKENDEIQCLLKKGETLRLTVKNR